MPHVPTALIADDEPLLRAELAAMLAKAWPALQVVAQVRNGREAVAQFEALQPDVCFLDVQMPGWSGVDAARAIGRRAQLVFVTAFDRYAVQAFDQGVLDYLVKPVAAARLAETVQRLQERLALRSDTATALAPAELDALLLRLAQHLRPGAAASAPGLPMPTAPSPHPQPRPPPQPPPLRWLRATVGQQLRLIPVDAIDYLRADAKYTLVAWRDDAGAPAQALISLSLKELLPQLDAGQFAQVHRSVVVNLAAVSHLTRGAHETADLHLKGRPERLPVSRSHLHRFRQM